MHLTAALLAALAVAARPTATSGQCADGLPRVASNVQGQLTLCPGNGNTTVVEGGLKVEGPVQFVATDATTGGRELATAASQRTVADLEAQIRSLHATLALVLGNSVFIRILDSAGNVGSDNSIVLTSKDVPVIAYYDATNGDLKLAVCNDATCSTAAKPRALDMAGNVGADVRIAMTSRDAPVIVYYDRTNGDLKLIVCNDTACTGFTPKAVDGALGVNVGQEPAVAVTSNDIPIISHNDASNANLKLAVCHDPKCNGNTPRNPDPAGNIGDYTSIALTSRDIPVIAYSDDVNRNLKLAICDDRACSGAKDRILADGRRTTIAPSVALTSMGVPVVSYYDATPDDLMLALCSDASCSRVTLVTLDSVGSVGTENSLALTSQDTPVVSYYDSTNGNLKLAVCHDPTCSSATLRTLDSVGNVGTRSSLRLTSQGFPVISYYDETNGDLKLIVCGDLLCSGV